MLSIGTRIYIFFLNIYYIYVCFSNIYYIYIAIYVALGFTNARRAASRELLHTDQPS